MGFFTKSAATLAAVTGVVVGLALATPAYAQDYTVTTVSDQYATPPSNKTNLNLPDDGTTTITLPFDFPFYGRLQTRCVVGSNGFIQINPSAIVGWVPQNAFPSTREDGLIVIRGDDLDPSSGGGVYTHISGSAPNRIFHITWEGVPIWNHFSSTHYLQIQLYETSGRIVLSYGNTQGTWEIGDYGWRAGIQGVGSDRRYSALFNNGTTYNRPSTDFQFDPDITRISGTLHVDEIVADANGFGNSQRSAQVLSGASVTLFSGATPLATALTDSDGNFEIEGAALDSSQSGSVKLLATNLACDVLVGQNGTQHAFDLVANVSFGADRDLGQFSIGDAQDADGTFRGALFVAQQADRLRNAVLAELPNESIPKLAIVLDANSTQGTQYFGSTSPTVPAWLRIGSIAASNPDLFDASKIAGGYAHHILASLTTQPSLPGTGDFDAISNDQHAFAEAFGYALFALLNSTSTITDATGANSGMLIDLEDPQPATRKGPDVVAWVAAALYDIIDGANEAHDFMDGSAALDGLDVIASLTSFPTAQLFYDNWGFIGKDPTGLATNFIYHGLISDDVAELNNSLAQAYDLGALGFRRTGFVLNQYDEDWYKITVLESVVSVKVDVVFDRSKYSAQITTQLLHSDGSNFAAGAADGLAGPWRISSGTATPGVYYLRVVHTGGSAAGDYAIQASSQLVLQGVLPSWTIGRPYDYQLSVKGGIQPYTLKIAQFGQTPQLPPPGLVLSSGTLRMAGTPNMAGDYEFVLQVDDSSSPPSSVFVSQDVTINDVLRLSVGEFTTLALGKPIDISFGFTGGTPPLSVFPGQGTLPQGLTLSDTELRIFGTPTSADSGDVSIEASDVAGSNASATTTVIVCNPVDAGRVTIDLAAGKAVGGVYLDGVAGTRFDLKVTTSRRRAKRDLRLVVYDEMGQDIESGKVILRKGKLILKGFELPRTGRYFAVLESAAGDASQIVAVPKLTPAKVFKDEVEDYGVGDPATQITFGAFEGTKWVLKGKLDKNLGNRVQVQAVVTPEGNVEPASTLFIEEKNGKITIAGTADVTGTWTLLVSPRPGPRGPFKYKMKFNHPKGASYSAD